MFTQRLRERRGKSGFTLTEMLLSMTVLFLLGAVTYVVVTPIREKMRQATCASNLHQMGQAVMLYANDHPGSGCQGFYGLPIHYEILYPHYVKDKSVFRCPDDVSGNALSYGFHVWRERDPYYISSLRRFTVVPDWCQLYAKLGDDFPLVWDPHHTNLNDLSSGFRRWIVLFRGGQVESVITDRSVASTSLRPRHALVATGKP